MLSVLFALVGAVNAAPLVIDTCASYVMTGNTITCAVAPPAVCPPGQVGTPPNCTTPPPSSDLCAGLRVIGNQALPFAGAAGGPSSSAGAFGDNTVWLFSLVVPAGQLPTASAGAFQVAEFGSQPTTRELTLSRYPCDFRPYDSYGNNGPIAISKNGTTAAVGFTVGCPSAACRSQPGVMLAATTYYFSARNWSEFPLPNGGYSCGIASCNATFNYQPTR